MCVTDDFNCIMVVKAFEILITPSFNKNVELNTLKSTCLSRNVYGLL